MFKYTILIFILLISGILPLNASTISNVEIDGICYRLDSNHEASVISRQSYDRSYDSYSGDITVLDSIIFKNESYIVKSISYAAFANCTYLTSVILPDCLETLGESAFEGCTALSKFTVPKKLMQIGKNAFKSCPELKSVYVQNIETWCRIQFYHQGYSNHQVYYDLTSNPLQNGADLYVGDKKFTNLILPESVTSISPYTFYGCSSLEEIEIMGNIGTIYPGAFSCCSNLRSINLRNIGTISSGAIDLCPKLKLVTLCNIGRIGTGFYMCDSLECIFCEGYCRWSGDDDIYSLVGSKSLHTMQLPSNMVEANVLYDSNQHGYLRKLFPSVKQYIIPEGTTYIGNYKFFHCDSLESIYIPSSLKSIGIQAFQDCHRLKSVHICDLASWCNISFDHTGPYGTIDYYGNPFYDSYADLYIKNERVTKLHIPETTSIIKECVFHSCTSIDSVYIPNSVNQIEMDAFSGCSNLSYVRFPETEVLFGRKAFRGCPRLTSVGPYNSGCSVEYGWDSAIPANAFECIQDIRKVIIPATIQSIGSSAFSGCTTISEIYVNATTPPAISYDSFHNYDATLFVPGGTSELYKAAKYWNNFNIIELIDIDSICIATPRVDLVVGDSMRLEVTISPFNATYQTLYWQSSNSDIVSVEGNGIIIGHKTGQARISASTTDGTNLTAYCDVFVTNPVSKVTLDKSSITLEVGQSSAITANCYPENADDKTITWLSDDVSIAEIVDGIIQARSLGRTKIRARSVTNVEAVCEVNIVPTLATSINVHPSSVDIHTGDSIQLKATLQPTNATTKLILWESNNPEIADVDENGVVRALSNGVVLVRANTTDGTGLSDSCKVTVTTLSKQIELNIYISDLLVGEGLQLIATIQPATTLTKTVKWKSSDNNVATVSEDGFVKAIATGRASITASTLDGTNLYASCIVNVTNPVISVSLDKTSAQLEVGDEIQLVATCMPANADNTEITWRSSNKSVATVENGLVKALSLGTTVITANSVNGKEARCSLVVEPTPVESITLSKTVLNLNANDTYKLAANVLPSKATNKTLMWTTSNVNVASVDADGLITAKSTGVATIMAKSTDGTDKFASCIVNVKTPVLSIAVSPQTVEMLIDENMQLMATCTPENADNTTIAWASSDKQIAIVSSTGLLTAKSAGEVTITATTTDGTLLSSDVAVRVNKHPQTIEWNQDLSYILNGGELVVLSANSSSGLPVSYSSSDESIASIFDMGDVIYLNPGNIGTTTITAIQAGNSYYEATSMTKEARVIDPNGVDGIAAERQYVVYTIDGIRVGTFNEDEYKNFIQHTAKRGLYVVNGTKIINK